MSTQPSIISQYLPQDPKRSSRNSQKVIDLVSARYFLERGAMQGHSNEWQTCKPRQICMYILRETTNLSFTQIGKILGMNHTTVIHGVRKVATLRLLEPQLDEIIAEIINKI